MSRRATLGPVSQSSLNARRVSSVGFDTNAISKPSRMSLVPAGGPSRMSMGPSRLSAIPAPRKSSMQYRGSSMPSSARLADPRNITDKQFINNSIRALIKYLTEHSFDHAISPKILTRPSNKDFSNILMFLFRQIDPNLTCTGKFEDEVVTIFKQLGYPWQISKANISAAGTPHAWPALLASLAWLIELLTYDEEAAIGGVNAIEQDAATLAEDAAASEKAFYAYLGTGYSLFLAGEDAQYAELEEQFVRGYQAQNALLRDQISSMEQKNSALAADIADVEKRRGYLPELQSKRQDYLKDLAKFQQLIAQLEKHKEQLVTKTEARQVGEEKLVVSLQTLHEEIAELRERISTQEISPEDVRRMVSQREQLEQSLQQVSEARQVAQRRVWELEMDLRDRVQALDDSARSYNSIADDLKLIPRTARNARGYDLAIQVDVRAKRKEELLRTDVHAEIIPTLQSFRAELSEAVMKIRGDIMADQDTLEEAELLHSELEEQRILAESKSRRAEESYKRERAALDQSATLHSQELDSMEARLARLRDTAVEEARVTAALRRLDEARASREAQLAHHMRRKRELTEEVMDVVAMCAEHREMVQQRVRDTHRLFSNTLETHLLGKGIGAAVNVALLGDSFPLPVTPMQIAAATTSRSSRQYKTRPDYEVLNDSISAIAAPASRGDFGGIAIIPASGVGRQQQGPRGAVIASRDIEVSSVFSESQASVMPI